MWVLTPLGMEWFLNPAKCQIVYFIVAATIKMLNIKNIFQLLTQPLKIIFYYYNLELDGFRWDYKTNKAFSIT